MTPSQKTFISILRCFVTGEKFLSESDVDWGEVIGISKQQSLLGMLYCVLEKAKDESSLPSDEQMTFLKTVYLWTVSQSVRNQAASEEVCNAFSIDRVVHVMLKGMTVKKYYPVPELRTMGDLDFLVYNKNKTVAGEVLTKLGYTCKGNVSAGKPVSDYQKANINLELHTDLFYLWTEDSRTRIPIPLDWDSFKPENDGGYTLVPTKEYNMFLQIAHAAKHFRSKGCGFRYILDFAFMLPHYDDWNSTSLAKLLSLHNLIKFYETIISYCVYRLGMQINNPPVRLDDATMSMLDAEFFREYVHGNRNQQLLDETVKAERTYKNMAVTKIYLIFSHILLPKKALIKRYPFLKKYPWLACIAHVLRIFDLIFNKKSRTDASKKLEIAGNIDIESARARIDFIEKIFG